MKAPFESNPSRRGTVLIFALLVVLASTVVLAGWATMLATRALYPESVILSQQRRIARENGRMLARQYFLSSMASSPNIPATNILLSSGWGGFSSSAAAVNTLSNSATPAAYNPFSPGERWGFEQTLTANITTADSTNAWSFRLRGRSPVFAGYPLVLQLAADSVSSSVSSAAALLWTNSTACDFTSSSYQAPEKLTALVGGGANISPFPYVPLAAEYPAGELSFSADMQTTPLTSGMISIADDPSVTTDGILITSSGGVQTIDLDLDLINASSINATGSALLLYQIDAEPASITSIQLRMTGTATSSLPPLHILYQAGSVDLAGVTLIGSNQRRTQLSVIKNSSLAFTTSGAADWRLGVLLQGSTSSWSLGGTLTLVGGIHSNANISVTSGTIDLQKESDPGGLDSMASRMIWLEENQTE